MIENVCSSLEPEIVTLIHNIITLIKIAVPIALVVFGMIDFARGVMAGKEDEVKKGQNNFIKRLIAGAVVFLMITVSQLVVSIFDKDSNGQFWMCADAIMNGDTSNYKVWEDLRSSDEIIKENFENNKEVKLICNFEDKDYDIIEVKLKVEEIKNFVGCNTAINIEGQNKMIIKEDHFVNQCSKDENFTYQLSKVADVYECEIK